MVKRNLKSIDMIKKKQKTFYFYTLSLFLFVFFLFFKKQHIQLLHKKKQNTIKKLLNFKKKAVFEISFPILKFFFFFFEEMKGRKKKKNTFFEKKTEKRI